MLTKQQYPSWHALLTEAYHHGISNMVPEHLEEALKDIAENTRRSLSMSSEPDGPPRLKPSSGLICQGQAALMLEAAAEGRTIDGGEPNRVTFALGHYHHALVYAALESALPADAVKLVFEEEKQLADELPWWPEKGTPGFSHRGFIDITLELLDPEWLAPGMPRRLVADVKTKAGRSMQYGGAIHNCAEDVFGNAGQVAVYSEIQGTLDAGGIIININKEAPALPEGRIGISYIRPDDLKEARDNVQRRLEKAQAGEFLPELWLRRDEMKSTGRSKLFVPCNQVRGAEAGVTYCDVSTECAKRREGWAV